ncbi:helix-turn-helix domain-containing protein [Rosistilla oblonga]|uniref:helix-turn-helix domain-containing protein n=1 Tax=Rosistilla oblonga TaxID=2527990 RepID=UPI003A96FA08
MATQSFMTRHPFQIDKPYAAKLVRVASRPIENDSIVPVQLIRLEFAIYWMMQGQRLESQGEVACRDLVVSKLLATERDAGAIAYAQALRVDDPINEPMNWIRLERGGRWIELKFGAADIEGGRNPFAEIKPFDVAGWEVKEYRYDLSARWVTISAAADAVEVSASTVRRRVDALEAAWGSELVRRTDGDHRRIYLPMFINVWDD